MSPRTTRSIVLGLIGSAVIMTLFWSCQASSDDQQQTLADNQTPGHGGTHSTTRHTHHYYRARPWFWGWGSSYRSSPSGGYYSRPSSPSHSTSSSAGRSSSSSATSRGGFGGTGHSAGS